MSVPSRNTMTVEITVFALIISEALHANVFLVTGTDSLMTAFKLVGIANLAHPTTAPTGVSALSRMDLASVPVQETTTGTSVKLMERFWPWLSARQLQL